MYKLISAVFSLFAVFNLIAGDLILESENAVYLIDDTTGAVSVRTGQTPVASLRNYYQLMAKSGDLKSDETKDKVAGKRISKKEIILTCVNAGLPELRIIKRYWIENNGLRRELTFLNAGHEKRYIIPFTESTFQQEFRERSYYFGAGYLGPFIPAPRVGALTRVDKYVQTSKGMVLVNADPKLGSFTNYRVKINDEVVYPWWQSSIGRYREYDDRLYYTPRGWRMSLGCLDLNPNGGSIRYTDAIVYFPGDLFTFFSDVYGKDREVQNAIAAIEPVAPETGNILCTITGAGNGTLKFIAEMLDEGEILINSTLLGTWFDYKLPEKIIGASGGWFTPDELQRFSQSYRDISPRIKTGQYGITVSVTPNAAVFKEHREWFRIFNREGKKDPLFPGLRENYQSMMNKPEVREYSAATLVEMAERLGNRFVYVDEAQQNNTINWQQNELIRDDHLVLYWKLLRQKSRAKNMFLFFNGSGQPFADINFMENARMMSPANWREYAGIALGLELFDQYRKHTRISPLYWHLTRDNDYSNRILALGWVPTLQYSEAGNNLRAVRACFETGNTDPVNVKYTPDWKSDPRTEVESYAGRRLDSSDVIMSFINRAQTTSDIPVKIDLSTLGFRQDERINIWSMPVRRFGEDVPDYFLSNREYREIYRKHGWNGGTIGAPQLIYSGNAAGALEYTIRNCKPDHMTQFIATRSPLALYTVNDLGMSYFYTSFHDVKIDGSKVHNPRRKVEILLADKDLVFTDITVNNAKTEVRDVDIGGLVFQCVTLPQGDFEIQYKTTPRTPTSSIPFKVALSGSQIEADKDGLYVLEHQGRSIYTGQAPIAIPEQHPGGEYTVRRAGTANPQTLILPPGKGTSVKQDDLSITHPEQKNTEKVNAASGNVTITQQSTYVSDWVDAFELQRDIPPYIVSADAAVKTLIAGTSHREKPGFTTLILKTYAGFELNGARLIRLRLANTFYANPTLANTHVTYNYKDPSLDFAGLVIDYRVNGKYAKRVDLSAGLYDSKLRNPLPPWGCARPQDQHFDLGPLVDTAPEQTFSLNLEQFAPPDWDGTAYLSVGVNRVYPNRHFSLEILEFNNPGSGDFIRVFDGKSGTPDPLNLMKLARPPKSLKSIDPAEWRNWAKIDHLQKLKVTPNPLTQPTLGYLAYDNQYLYVGISAGETQRKVLAEEKYDIWKNDVIELYFVRPDGHLLQLLGDVRGQQRGNLDLKTAAPTDGMVVQTQVKQGKGFDIFMAIPWKLLQIQLAEPGIELKFNLCRTRQGSAPEFSTWGPADRRYAEPDSFGKIILGKFNPGQGRNEEIYVAD